MYQVDLCHLGDRCQPGILIDDILNIHQKSLFMLGEYPLNTIIQYLNDKNYENIFNKEHLQFPKTTGRTKHTLYDFGFVHDYRIDANGNVLNTQAVIKRFREKILNFKQMLQNDRTTVYINFTDHTSIDTININGIVDWLNTNKKNKNYHLILFTMGDLGNIPHIPNVSILQLDRMRHAFWQLKGQQKIELYREIYTKFIACLETNTITHDFPKTFEETHFGKTNDV